MFLSIFPVVIEVLLPPLALTVVETVKLGTVELCLSDGVASGTV